MVIFEICKSNESGNSRRHVVRDIYYDDVVVEFLCFHFTFDYKGHLNHYTCTNHIFSFGCKEK